MRISDWSSDVCSSDLANSLSYTARDLNDPSWLLASSPLLSDVLSTPPSDLAQTLRDRISAIRADPTTAIALPLNAPLVPLCTTWSLQCSGDPYRYPDVDGAAGRIYMDEARSEERRVGDRVGQ